MPDAIVVGAGLAGLSAARDLAAGGTDVVVLEARDRPGGRVVQTPLADGRLVQLGGELTGPFQSSYRGLVEELGLTLEPSFVADPGEETYLLAEGRFVGDGYPWMSDEDRASYAKAEEEFARLAKTVDPEDPWSHPEAERLDRLSIGEWMRDVGATRNAVRARDLFALALSSESVERTSLLSELRKEASAGASGFYEYETWEAERVAEGSATVALRMAEELGHTGPLRDPGEADPDQPLGLLGDHRRRGALRGGDRRLGAPGRAPARRPGRGRLRRAPRLAAPPAPRARREARLRLRVGLLGGGRDRTATSTPRRG